MLKENSLEYFLVYSEKADVEGRMHDREEKENFVRRKRRKIRSKKFRPKCDNHSSLQCVSAKIDAESERFCLFLE